MAAPAPMTEFLNWYAELSKIGFAGLLLVLLFGSYWEIWMWVKTHVQRIAEKEAECVRLSAEHARQITELKAYIDRKDAEIQEWKQMALGLLTPLESAIRTTKRGG